MQSRAYEGPEAAGAGLGGFQIARKVFENIEDYQELIIFTVQSFSFFSNLPQFADQTGGGVLEWGYI